MKILQTVILTAVLFALFYWGTNALLLKFPDVVFWVKGLFN